LSQTTHTLLSPGKGKGEKQIRKRNTETITEKLSMLSALAHGPEKQHRFQGKPFVTPVALNWSTFYKQITEKKEKKRKKKRKKKKKKRHWYLRYLI